MPHIQHLPITKYNGGGWGRWVERLVSTLSANTVSQSGPWVRNWVVSESESQVTPNSQNKLSQQLLSCWQRPASMTSAANFQGPQKLNGDYTYMYSHLCANISQSQKKKQRTLTKYITALCKRSGTCIAIFLKINAMSHRGPVSGITQLIRLAWKWHRHK